MFSPYLFPLPTRLTIAAAISVVVFIATSLFLYQVHASPLTTFSAQGGAAVAFAATVSAMREMHVANNGLVLLRGAQIVSISGSTIQVEMNWNAAHLTWTVQTNSATLFFTSTGENETSPHMQVGDSVTITGMLVAQGTQTVINATYIDTE